MKGAPMTPDVPGTSAGAGASLRRRGGEMSANDLGCLVAHRSGLAESLRSWGTSKMRAGVREKI